jgi:hypothetical protein
MSLDWKTSVSAVASTVTINDIAEYIKPDDSLISPIDRFYLSRDSLLNGVNQNSTSNNQSIPPLILVGLISLTENYFRDVMSEIITICPKAKEKSAERSLNLATAWFGYGKLEKGAFENISFSNVDAIKKNLANLIGYSIDSTNQINGPLEEFGKLCELRHAIVHSASLLAGKNAIKLGLPTSKYPVKVQFGYPEIQESAAVCNALVCSINLELFIHLSLRWLYEWPSTPAYSNKNTHSLFKKVWDVFYSSEDAKRNLISSPFSMMKVKNKIIKTNGS